MEFTSIESTILEKAISDSGWQVSSVANNNEYIWCTTFRKRKVVQEKYMMYKTEEIFKMTKEELEKNINHPQRYGGDTTYECIKVLESWMSKEEYRGFLKGNAIKYLCRLGKKDEAVQEANKAKW